ncbi:NAD(P)/FAD-dependent oxidoreductase [Streptomyces sp. CBMA29]|uniref:NAD(P)/FAD-dependent oxidoreductase n=1 Tax=Streptomyces sp. CBMA29 TaxID=1896314 RepID=UPI0016620680|nr:FAD-dependent oxidoreductase [Streptomyces sp. CBMA29]MBD0735425.1 nitrite reductase [Streptomyces sp. CBMA29]
MDIVVVGGGMAGARLAQQLAPYAEAHADAPDRAEAPDRTVTVTLVGEEPHPPYNRVLLAEVLAGRYEPEKITLPAVGIRTPPRRAVRLDRDARRVVCDDGTSLPYDRLVLATGSNPVLPPLRGLFEDGADELPLGVRCFRTMDDCLALASAAGHGTRVVVVGGGLLGVSAAQALAARGARVVVAQQGERLMERHLDDTAAALLRRHLEAQGVEVHTECRVRGLLTQRTPDGRRAVRSVELSDGYCLGAELVVLACGVRPRVGLARAAGLAVAQGVVVDDLLRTSDPAVHAIGDCAQHDGVLYGLAGAARDQADVLARVLVYEARTDRRARTDLRAPTAGTRAEDIRSDTAGGAPRYGGTRALTRLTLAPGPPGSGAALLDGAAPLDVAAPLDIAAFGDPEPGPGDDVLRLTDGTTGAYRKVVVREDRLVGGILLGDLAAVGTVAGVWEGDEPLPSAPLLHLLTDDGGY